MTLYKIINVSPIQEHPYQTRYGGAEYITRIIQSLSVYDFISDERKITTDIIRVRGYVAMFICKDLQM
jgi:hypothetical protein